MKDITPIMGLNPGPKFSNLRIFHRTVSPSFVSEFTRLVCSRIPDNTSMVTFTNRTIRIRFFIEFINQGGRKSTRRRSSNVEQY